MAKFSLVLLGLCLIGVSVSSSTISHNLRKILKHEAKQDVIVTMKGDIDNVLSSIKRMEFSSREGRLNAVYIALTTHANRAQKNIQTFLNKEGIEFESFWISNQVFIRQASRNLIEALAKHEDVTEITENARVELEKPIVSPNQEPTPLLEWGVIKIRANEAWTVSNGTGAVVGVIDTGVLATHEALASRWVGLENNGWYDPYPSRYQTPQDDNGHGTHVTGTICGGEGIGVAPGAKFISCRGCDSDACATAELVACGQFMLCPHDTNGGNPDCSKAPQLVSNSWGGSLGTFFNAVLSSWEAARIYPVFAYGNNGPLCRSGSYPGGQGNAYAVGATQISDAIALFSSKGPTTTGLIKPNIAAPGVNVRSAYNTGNSAYSTLSGTSMATPHIAGVMALIAAHRPGTSFDAARVAIQETAVKGLPQTGLNCGEVDEGNYPNNVHGHGRVDAFRAVNFFGKNFKKM